MIELIMRGRSFWWVTCQNLDCMGLRAVLSSTRNSSTTSTKQEASCYEFECLKPLVMSVTLVFMGWRSLCMSDDFDHSGDWCFGIVS
jgi:hypothetical protein